MTPPLSLDHFTLVYINYLTVSNVKLPISQALFPLRSGYGSLRDNPECLRGPGPERGAIYPFFPLDRARFSCHGEGAAGQGVGDRHFFILAGLSFLLSSSIEQGSFS
jgi:hypothetical protein